ncbi:MAG: MutS-related protein [Sarcina sp.]
MGMFDNNSFNNYTKVTWPETIPKKREFEDIKKYYENFSKGSYGEVDDQSWSDLSMDEVFTKVDRTYSSAGESILYNMLRKPLYNKEELNRRWSLIKTVKNDEENRIKIQGQFFDLSKDRKGQVIDFITKDIDLNESRRKLFIFIGRILPIIFFLLCFVKIYFIIPLAVNIIINGCISGAIRGKLMEKEPIEAIAYVGAMIKVANKLLKIDSKILEGYKDDLKEVTDILMKDKRSFKSVKRTNGIDDLNILSLIKDAWTEAVGQTTFDLEIAYYSVAKSYKEYREPIKKLYETLGEIDGLIAMAAYIESLDIDVSNPNFIDETKFEIKEGIHPLLKKPVANSINIDKKGIVITGTNMSGKSTFLRMLGINIIFAQSFNFVLADKYEAPFFNLVSSISPEDDVNSGKSYYLAEAEAILRIIKALEGEKPVFCLIDEIFRGTNPVERIAASEEILRYIQKRNSISLVATHDRELTDLLIESHDFYHFTEKVNEETGMSFDYKLKSGVLKKGNAIKLLRFVGYPDEITINAERKIEENKF